MRLYKRIYACAYWVGLHVKNAVPKRYRMNGIIILSFSELGYFLDAILASHLNTAQYDPTLSVFMTFFVILGFNILYFFTGKNYEEAVAMLPSIKLRERLFYTLLLVLPFFLTVFLAPHKHVN